MTDEEFRAHLTMNLYTDIRKLPDGWVAITAQIFNWALCAGLDASGYARRYDYDDLAQCRADLAKMESVDDVPVGWTRRLPEPFFFTIAGYKSDSMFVLHIGECLAEREIITQARFHKNWKEDFEEPLTIEEAVDILNEDGGSLEIFNVATEVAAFLDRAEALGLGEEAAKLVANVKNWRRAGES